MKCVEFRPDWAGRAVPFRKTWGTLGNIDQFRWLSRADVLEHLRMARDELGIRHVRAVAMYSPEMRVWDHRLTEWHLPVGSRTLSANWQMVDISIEGLLDLGLKPIYTTCFTPKGMTGDPAVCWPDRNSVGLPKDLGAWRDFVSSGLRHHVERFGIGEVRSWYFECWNEPNLEGFFSGTKEDFFRLWSETWRAVKSVDSSLSLGGPSTARGEWISDFLDFTKRDGTPPDYLISHIYNNDSESSPLSPFDGPASSRVKDSPHFASGVIRGVRKELDAWGWKGEVHWNEWGRSWFPCDPLKETALEAAFIVKTMAEVSQEADAFAFWCLSDIYDQCGFQSSEFQAHYGMLSLHGLRKPAWMAHVLLNRLGSHRVDSTGGDGLAGIFATRDEAKRVALVYAYPERHDAAPSRMVARVAWPFSTPTLFRIGAEENNILATWRELGAPEYPTKGDLLRLREANKIQAAPEGTVHMETGPEGRMAVFELECPGVAFLSVATLPASSGQTLPP